MLAAALAKNSHLRGEPRERRRMCDSGSTGSPAIRGAENNYIRGSLSSSSLYYLCDIINPLGQIWLLSDLSSNRADG